MAPRLMVGLKLATHPSPLELVMLTVQRQLHSNPHSIHTFIAIRSSDVPHGRTAKSRPQVSLSLILARADSKHSLRSAPLRLS